MRGHERLIALRLQGKAPADVHIDTDGGWPVWWLDWSGPHAHILVARNENVALLDLRCLIGLLVFVHGEDEGRVGEIADACRKAQARRVVAFAGDLA